MKRLLYVLLFVCIVFSCKKETNSGYSSYNSLEEVKAELKDSLSVDDYSRLNFNSSILSKADKDQLYFLRIPFVGEKISEKFLIVKIDRLGHIEKGRIVHLQGIQYSNSIKQGINGFISISTFDNKIVVQSKISNGFISAFHSQKNAREMLKGEDVLQEVVVIAYVHYDSGVDYSTWLWLNSLFYTDTGGGGTGSTDSGYYGSIDGGGYTGGGGGSYGGSGYTSGSGDPYQEDLMEFEAEYIYAVPEIDVWKYFNCFDNVPSAGATYTIKLCVDIPSNNNPGASSPSSGSSAGHTFLTITKSNGNSKVSQSLGFYPKSEPSLLDPFSSVTSTIKDNGGNEYNAAIEMTISETQFDLIKNNAISKSTLPYNLGSYNCTSYAMDIFNCARQTPITISPYKVVSPGDPNPYGTSEPNAVFIEKSPQMLFFKLQEMKNNNVLEATKIEVDQSHNSLSPISHGECN